MPDGSSSEAPVTRPGPIALRYADQPAGFGDCCRASIDFGALLTQCAYPAPRLRNRQARRSWHDESPSASVRLTRHGVTRARKNDDRGELGLTRDVTGRSTML